MLANGLCKAGKQELLLVEGRFIQPDVYNVIMNSLCKESRVTEALDLLKEAVALFNEMVSKSIKPGIRTDCSRYTDLQLPDERVLVNEEKFVIFGSSSGRMLIGLMSNKTDRRVWVTVNASDNNKKVKSVNFNGVPTKVLLLRNMCQIQDMKTGMRNKLVRRIKKLLSCSECRTSSPNDETSVDVREEYANAFRTESYTEFWTRVIAYSNGESSSCLSRESTTSARLPSYRLFAEHLLDPNQPTVSEVLSKIQNQPIIHSLLLDYFLHTSNAFLLCSHLLKDIDRVRAKYTSLKTVLQCVPNNQVPSSMLISHLAQFSNSLNPFATSSPSPCRVRVTQCHCSDLQKRLELSRDKVQAKLQLIVRLKYGSACLLVIVTTSLMVVVATHGFALLVAVPGLASLNLASKWRLVKVAAQLDAAAKGTYILNKDLETISRLVARLNDELEHMRATVRFWLERKEDKIQADGEVARLLKKNQCTFSDQLDELEEHLYLCLMTINRARDLVLNQITH
ncbi:UPF0496 protein At3g49070-like [Abrus precatorius]|uniref:UPF0496 protein At3g49070-like n=1 Tax=Abrus precatorius TaxID=3816 RepID=A0A8B8JML4_ABRPR|nr:UPF0496 protein At3g49070-like [Abrus precatorius]